MKRWSVLFLFVTLTAYAKDKTVCGEKELTRQDCRLTLGGSDFRLLTKTVAWSDGTWQSVDPMPMKGEAAEWEKVTLELVSGRPLLQFWLWEKGLGENQIQSLHWYVCVAQNQKFTVLSEGVVRKRRPEVVVATGKAPAKPKFIYDAWDSFGIKPLKNGQLEWHLNEQKKILETKQVKHGV